ncbi:similar to AMP-binding enzyme [Botrytis cinerea T4]|nr:similar to AMP-binding enzyme [Botrytis cinerea T4]
MASILFEEDALKPIRRKQLLNNIVDGLAKVRPGTIYAEVPRSSISYEFGYRKISYANFANAINGLAQWLHDTLGPAENFPTLAYIGPNDFRYNALMLAAVKAGYKMFFSSPRNSIPSHANLFKILDCKILITVNPPLPITPSIIETTGVQTIECPDVDELLDTIYPHYHFNKTFEQARKEPLVILHTSGTTGFPKPIVWNHETRLLNTLPPFHAGGIFMTLLNAVFNQIPHPLSGVPLSTKIVLEALNHVKADSVLLAPPFVEEVGANPEMLNFLVKNIDVLLYGGGDVSQATGDKISKRLKLSMIIGSTESGAYPAVFPTDKWPSDDWKCLHFHPNAGIKLRPHSENRYEAVLIRNSDPEKVQPIFSVFPSLNEWETHDLYAPHPSIPDLWLCSGRSDDIIVLLTGEKTNPLSMEQQMSHHHEVRAALVIGAHRFQTALLIELVSLQALSTVERAKAIERIWPTIHQANQE